MIRTIHSAAISLHRRVVSVVLVLVSTSLVGLDLVHNAAARSRGFAVQSLESVGNRFVRLSNPTVRIAGSLAA